MTLKNLISSDVDQVFLNTDDFAIEVQHHPLGAADGTAIKVIRVPDHLEGSNEVHGDGRTRHRQDGDRIRVSEILELSDTVVITVSVNGKGGDQFVMAGKRYFAKRIIGADELDITEGMQAVLVVRADAGLTRRGDRRG